MVSKTDFFSGLILLFVCALFAWQLSLIPPLDNPKLFGAASFPLGVIFLLSLCALRLIYVGLYGKIPQKNLWPEKAIASKIIKFFSLIMGYIFAFVFFGDFAYTNDFPSGVVFISTTFLFLFLAQVQTRPDKKLVACIIAITTSLLLFMAFFYLFKVMLP